jgi:hypothetical protein
VEDDCEFSESSVAHPAMKSAGQARGDLQCDGVELRERHLLARMSGVDQWVSGGGCQVVEAVKNPQFTNCEHDL